MQKDPIKVFIVEDHAIFREGLKRILESLNNIQVVGEAGDGETFLREFKSVNPDIVLMDIKMPVCDGLQATERALKIDPDLKIIVLSFYGEEDYLYSMILLGSRDFCLKPLPCQTLNGRLKQWQTDTSISLPN